MQHALRPWITICVALAGASLIAISPVAPPLPDVQHRAIRPIDYDEFDTSQLMTTTQDNLTGLESVLSSSNWLTDPDISQGLSTLFSDLSTGTSNPVTNPFALLSEGALLLAGGDYASNAASTALTAVSDNIESALSSGNFSAALTDLENGPSTVLYAFLNGYPEAVGSAGLISPEFGLLTNTADGAATGEIDSLAQLSNTIADEVSAVGGNTATSTPTLLGAGTLDLGINVDTILNDLVPSGSLTLPFSLDSLLNDAAPSGSLTLPFSLDSLLNDAVPSGTLTLPFSLDSLLNGAVPGGTLTLPFSLDSLLNLAASNGEITVPITPDQILTEIGNSGGSVTVPPISLSTFVSDVGDPCLIINPTPGSTNLCELDLSQFLKDAGAPNTLSVPSIPDSTVASDLESALGASGNEDITVNATDLEQLLGTSGSNDITVTTGALESLLGTSGSNDVSLSITDLETLLGTSGSDDLSVSITTLESILGTAGSQQVSIPLSTLESILPSTLSLDLTTPTVTGGTVPNFDVDLSQDLLAVLGSIAPVSSDLSSLLTNDPTLDVASLLSGLFSDLGVPISATGGDLPANLTGILAELLPGLVP
jgi:hypothetical protein